MGISRDELTRLVGGYDTTGLTVAALGGHSCLDVCHGAREHGFRTLALARRGRERTYQRYYATRDGEGCIDETLVLDSFADVTRSEVVAQLQERNAVLTNSRYWWVYFPDFAAVEEMAVPFLGSRDMVKLEERDCKPLNQYDLLREAGIRLPHIFDSPDDIDRLVIVKAAEALRGYERAFFFAASSEQYHRRAAELVERGLVTEASLPGATIEEFVLGAQVNLNFFYSTLSGELELMGTDMRRQTSLDGFLRLPADVQAQVLKLQQPKLVETGHVAVTMKESLLEKAFELGERFVATTQRLHPPGIVGPFALQGAVAAGEGREEFVIFDVSMRVPGSPGTPFTPYSGYRHGRPLSYGQRLALELRRAVEGRRLLDVLC